jgi:hypothetical protein
MAIRNWSGILLHAPGMLLNPKHIVLVSSHFFSFIISGGRLLYFAAAPRFWTLPFFDLI